VPALAVHGVKWTVPGKGVVLPLAPIGDLKLSFISRPKLKNMSKLPVGHIGETGAN